MAVTIVYCIACGGELPEAWLHLTCAECIQARAAAREPTAPTRAPTDLGDFAEHCKRLGMRTAKGEFVATDGTRLPYDWTFERELKKGSKDDNG